MIFKKKINTQEGTRILSERNIFDIHTHILPNIDDGSASVKESTELLCELSKQGIKNVVATPHYYPAEKSPDAFFEARENAFAALSEVCDVSMPKISLGAEVLYFRGISRIDGLERLCTQGTKTLLLEMPTDSWSEYMLREISEIQNVMNINIVMAHIERYFEKQPTAFFEQLINCGAKMQINAASLLGKQRRQLIKMLVGGQIHFIGSDCHNMMTRPVSMAEAVSVIKAYSDESVLEKIEKNCSLYFK